LLEFASFTSFTRLTRLTNFLFPSVRVFADRCFPVCHPTARLTLPNSDQRPPPANHRIERTALADLNGRPLFADALGGQPRKAIMPGPLPFRTAAPPPANHATAEAFSAKPLDTAPFVR
jgi:hypothetical protein